MIGSKVSDKPFRGTLDKWITIPSQWGPMILGISSETGKLRKTSPIVHFEYPEQPGDKFYVETENSIYELLNEKKTIEW